MYVHVVCHLCCPAPLIRFLGCNVSSEQSLCLMSLPPRDCQVTGCLAVPGQGAGQGQQGGLKCRVWSVCRYAGEKT